MKKILTILLSVFMVITTFTSNVLANDTYTITIDIDGGSLNNGYPDGWTDVGDGKYTKAFPADSGWVYFGNEWQGYEPTKDNYIFKGWLPEGSFFEADSVFLEEDTTVFASYSAILDVIVDLDGGQIDAADIPDGWTLVPGETDQYTKKYPEGEYYSWTILTEWENIVPTYPVESNKVFVKWENPNGFSLEVGDLPIKAKAGELKTVTVDFSGGIVLSSDPSWTLVAGTTDKYTKKFPEGYEKMNISSELVTGFSVQSFNGEAFFANSYSYDWSPSTVSGDNTVFTVTKYSAVTITVVKPENGMIFVDGEPKATNYELKVPEGTMAEVTSGILKLSKYSVIDDISIEIYGNQGYTLNKYTLNGNDINYNSITANSTITAELITGVQNYPIWVDGTQITSDNLSVLSSTVSYDPATKVLTLDGANIESDGQAAIFFGSNLTINVASNSTLKCTNNKLKRSVLTGTAYNDSFSANNINNTYNLNIVGDGKLTVELEDITNNDTWGGNVESIGIFAKNIKIETDVDIKCGAITNQTNNNMTFDGLLAKNLIINDSKLSINSGTINTQGPIFICYMIDSPVSLDNAELELTIGETIKPLFTDAHLNFTNEKQINFKSGKIVASATTSGNSIKLAPGANIISISGTTDDTTATDLIFVQKDANTPLVLTAGKYGISEGKDSTIDVSLGEPAEFRSTAEFSKFEKVEVNGIELVRNIDYEVREGSTIVKLLPSYLSSLDNGIYNITILSTDGYAGTTFTITRSGQSPSTDPKPRYVVPNTGVE